MNREGFSDFGDLRQRRKLDGKQREPDFDQRDEAQKDASREIRELARQRKWEEALEIFRGFQAPDPILSTAAMDACAKSMKLFHARRIFETMGGKHLPAYNVMINLLGRLKRVDEAEGLLQRLVSEGLEPNDITLCSLINGHGMVQDAASVFRVLEQIKAAGPVSPVCWSAAVSACARAGDAERVLELFRMMEAAGSPPGRAEYSSLILARARCKDETGAREAMEEMRRKGHKPDVISYTTLMISFYGKPDALEKSTALFADMQGEGVVPDGFAYNALLFAALDAKNGQRFREILADMDARGIARNRETEKRLRDLEELERSQAAGLETQDLRPLASGWEQRVDAASGHTYFWQTRDPAGTTTWERPT